MRLLPHSNTFSEPVAAALHPVPVQEGRLCLDWVITAALLFLARRWVGPWDSILFATFIALVCTMNMK